MQRADKIEGGGEAWVAFNAQACDLFQSGAELLKLYTGAIWTEGPVYFPQTDTVVFSDIPNSQLLEWQPAGRTHVVEENSYYTNGNTRDHAGCRVSCQHLTHSVIRVAQDGTQTVLVSHYDGKRLNSPNDVVVASDGAIWFTDPSYGILSDHEGRARASEQAGCFVYRIDPVSGQCDKMCDSLKMPNGLAFSADETVLYIADSSRSHFEDGYHHVFAFDVLEGQMLANQRVFYEVAHGVPDGMRIDEYGNLWCSSGRGIEIIDPTGHLIGHIPVPEIVANLTFGGKDGRRLFITASTSLYAMDVAVRGIDMLQK